MTRFIDFLRYASWSLPVSPDRILSSFDRIGEVENEKNLPKHTQA